MVGKKVSEGILSWKGADLTASFYVGNIDVGANTEEIKDYIESQNVKVVELEDIARRHNRFKSLKLVIKKKDIELIKNADFWPKGIIVRKFFRKSNNDGAAIPSHVQ